MGINERNDHQKMMTMRAILNFIQLFVFVLIAFGGNGQVVLMGDPGFPPTSPIDCSTFGVSGNNFQDPGGGANYPPNFNDTITFCPDLTQGTKVSITFAINTGYTFNVDGSDFIYVYDGPNASAPLLGIHNSVTSPTGFTHQASWNNPSGCLTVVFVSNGSNEGTGWFANVQCGNQPQPMFPHIEAYVNGTGANALNPLDTGFVDVCFGDSILFIAKPLFPHSLESTGYGYTQNVNNSIDFDWNISDGGNYPNNDSIWFTPPARAGYLVDLKITDIFPQSEYMKCKVRVSQLPSFVGTGPLDDAVCIGESTVLLGGVTQTDTVGVEIPAGAFELGGSYAGLTYLPDGSGLQYETTIPINGFPDGATITDAESLNEVCITMEHSFLGDLEIWLECPNGTVVPLVNSYNPGFLPGGNSGGGTFLGQPFDDAGGGGAGIGWEYCFSSVFNTINGSMTQNLNNVVGVPAVGSNPPLTQGSSIDSADVYEPETSFADFVGCPVNGDWTIHVQDNLGIDDGYIFEWGLFFDASYFAGLGGYQNFVVSDYWDDDPTIVSGQNDTLIVVQPDAPGSYPYTYHVTDDFGCPYDTTVFLNVLPGPSIFNDTTVCSYSFQVSGTQSYSGGTWTSSQTGVSFNNASNDNPLIIFPNSSGGVYTVEYTDNECDVTVSAEITIPGQPNFDVNSATICSGVTAILSVTNESFVSNFVWNTGATTPVIETNQAGTYTVTGSNSCYDTTITAEVIVINCNLEVPNIISLSSTAGNDVFYVKYEGIEEFDCVIMNRWGNKIYEYQDPAGKWDGYTQKGTLVEEGTYFYLIKAKFYGGEEVVKHGFVQVDY
jgi:subtilisin-like proprotein convertase family protein